MPNIYKRKDASNTKRGTWTAQQLEDAMTSVKNNTMGVNKAAIKFGIPKTTLKDRLKKNCNKKTPRLGPPSCLGDAAEQKLVNHIKKLQSYGFAPDRKSVRTWAFLLAEKLGVKHKFNKESGQAGYDWLQLFLHRHPDISIRKAEGVSIARATGMCKENCKHYFELLGKILDEHELHTKPSHIFNVDETGLQMNNKPGQVLAAKGSKNVSSITSGEKGETISVIACCNAEGTFLPPYVIFKGKHKKLEYLDGMPNGSNMAMGEKSAYVNGPIFFDWLKNHFLLRKPTGSVLLILDGHTSHTNSVEVLEFCEENSIILLCLPSHTTHYLQPLDRSFFKSLKSNFYMACNNYIRTNPTRKLSRHQFGKLLGFAWNMSASVKNGVAGFRASGISPYNPEIIPEYAYIGINIESTATQDVNESFQLNSRVCNALSGPPSPSYCNSSEVAVVPEINSSAHTPGRLLDYISPVPETSAQALCKKRGRQLASVLNTPERIQDQRKKKISNIRSSSGKKRKPAQKSKRAQKEYETSSDSDDEHPVVHQESDDSPEEYDENDCVGCGENYYKTSRSDDWIQCENCRRWLHERCFKYPKLCERCGKNNTNGKN